MSPYEWSFSVFCGSVIRSFPGQQKRCPDASAIGALRCGGAFPLPSTLRIEHVPAKFDGTYFAPQSLNLAAQESRRIRATPQAATARTFNAPTALILRAQWTLNIDTDAFATVPCAGLALFPASINAFLRDESWIMSDAIAP